MNSRRNDVKLCDIRRSSHLIWRCSLLRQSFAFEAIAGHCWLCVISLRNGARPRWGTLSVLFRGQCLIATSIMQSSHAETVRSHSIRRQNAVTRVEDGTLSGTCKSDAFRKISTRLQSCLRTIEGEIRFLSCI